MDYFSLIVSFFILLGSGTIKGGIGFGLPLVAVPFLSLIHPIELTLSLLSFPVMVSSIRLSFAGGMFSKIVKEKFFMLFFLFCGVFVGVSFLKKFDDKYVYLILGIILIIFILIGKLVKGIVIKKNKTLEIFVGFFAGLLGGMSSAYGPLVASYLSVIKLEKNYFVSTLNIMLMFGATFMILFFGFFKIYTSQTLVLSIMACIPVMIGLAIGERIRSRINNDAFHKIVFYMLLFMGLNLIRKFFM